MSAVGLPQAAATVSAGAMGAPQNLSLVEPARTRIMGILNVTPDSFSDGGRYLALPVAVEHAIAMVAAGADIIDIGGESTRPGADPVSADEEQRRVLPLVRELAVRGITVSIDTMNAGTALAAVEAGAAIINDVSGGKADPEMAEVVVATGVPFVVMHWRGASKTMNTQAEYTEVVSDVRRELTLTVEELIQRGVDPRKIVLDPGLGFAKTPDHNWRLLAELNQFAELGFPILIGASRKRFLGALLPSDAATGDRDFASAVVAALSAQAGVWAVRVHNIELTKGALDVAEAWRRGSND